MPDLFSRRALRAAPIDVAPTLLGATVRATTDAGEVAIRLTEVEAYDGARDPGSHAYRGRTARNAVMFGEPGHAYVYFTYGMHHCVNIVCRPGGTAGAVLLRAGVVVAGQDLARSRRPATRAAHELARGPANLARVLGLDRSWDGTDLLVPGSQLRLERGSRVAEDLVCAGPRVGLRAAPDVPWRFWVQGEASVSVYRPAVQRVRRSGTV